MNFNAREKKWVKKEEDDDISVKTYCVPYGFETFKEGEKRNNKRLIKIR